MELEKTDDAIGTQERDGSGQQNGDSADAPGDMTVVTDEEQAASTVQEQRRARTLSFAETLIQAGMLSAEQVSKAQETSRMEGLSLGRVLVRDGVVLARDLAAFTALHLGLTMVDLRSESLDPDVVGLLPEEVSQSYNVLAVRRNNSTLTVAMSDPTDLQALQDLSARTGLTIEPEVSTDQEIRDHIDIGYRLVRQHEREASTGGESAGTRLTADMLRSAQPAKFIDMLLEQAHHDNASDIHIEPTEHKLRLRFRIDGVLMETMTLPMDIHPTLISRIKIMSNMNIAERRKPQDGQLSFDSGERKIDVRAAICNTVYGEMAVLRLLDSGALSSLGLDQLGMMNGLESFQEMLKLPHGMILVSGPTGSGKSTTLASSIMTVNRTELNVITMEDPVENELPDANQLQVHVEAGVTFATLLRSILRLDPDVILVGEIRDEETATLAVEAALTGHLVLSTVHANDCVSTLLRMKDLGVPSYLAASAIVGIVAQRMVRKVCSGCPRMIQRPAAEQGLYEEVMGEKQDRFIYGAGCNVCAQTGYKGRTGIYEVMKMTDELRQKFLNEAPRHELWAQTIADGTIPLKKDAMMKVKQGITTLYEVLRVAESD